MALAGYDPSSIDFWNAWRQTMGHSPRVDTHRRMKPVLNKFVYLPEAMRYYRRVMDDLTFSELF